MPRTTTENDELRQEIKRLMSVAVRDHDKVVLAVCEKTLEAIERTYRLQHAALFSSIKATRALVRLIESQERK